MSINRSLFSSKKMDWETPQAFFDELNLEFSFTLDACATPENAKCKSFFTIYDDALKQDWFGNVWMNPPYGRSIGKWIRKAYLEVQVGNADLVVCLIPARTDTAYWHDYCMKGEIRFIRGRLCFSNAGRAPFPSAIVIFR